MKTSLIYLFLISVWCQDALAQSYANIKVFPLGETADSLYRAGYFRRALPYAQDVFASFGDMPVSDTSAYAKAMYRLGEIEYQSGYYDQAFPHLQRAFSLYYGISGMKDDICARMCCALSHAMIRELRWADDDAMLTRMIAEAERSKGVSEFARISIRWCQGNVCHNQRKYAEAKKIYERCKTDWEVIEATQTEEYCLMLNALSALYNQMDDEGKAMQLDLTGLDIHHQVYGARHPGSAIFLNALAENNRRLENWSVSMAYYEELIAIVREKIGEDTWMFGLVLFDLGYLNTQIGDYKQAEHLEEEALKITLAAHGKSHPEYAMIISGLARLAQLQGDLDKADSLFQESLQVRIETLGKGHPYFPAALTDLASVYLEKKQPNIAYPLLYEALAAQIKLEGPRHSSVATTLQQMALCRLIEGRYAEADSIMGLSGELFQSIFGDHSQIFTQNIDNRILTRICLNQTDKQILDWVHQGHKNWKNTAQRAMGYSSPRQLESLLFSLSFHNNLVNVIGALGNPAGLAYDNALLFKNLALQSRAYIFRKWNINGDTTALAAFKYWQEIQRRLSNELSKSQVKRQQVDSLEKLEFVPGAIFALARIARELDYLLVMVTNQDGLGTASFP
jgi:tetratricopeptide (TPR) repeat protein